MNKSIESFPELVDTYYPLPTDLDAKDGVESGTGATGLKRGRRWGRRRLELYEGGGVTSVGKSFEVLLVTSSDVAISLRKMSKSIGKGELA